MPLHNLNSKCPRSCSQVALASLPAADDTPVFSAWSGPGDSAAYSSGRGQSLASAGLAHSTEHPHSHSRAVRGSTSGNREPSSSGQQGSPSLTDPRHATPTISRVQRRSVYRVLEKPQGQDAGGTTPQALHSGRQQEPQQGQGVQQGGGAVAVVTLNSRSAALMRLKQQSIARLVPPLPPTCAAASLAGGGGNLPPPAPPSSAPAPGESAEEHEEPISLRRLYASRASPTPATPATPAPRVSRGGVGGGDGGASTTPEAAGGVGGGNAFLKRRSERVVSRPVDWSHVKAKTNTRCVGLPCRLFFAVHWALGMQGSCTLHTKKWASV